MHVRAFAGITPAVVRSSLPVLAVVLGSLAFATRDSAGTGTCSVGNRWPFTTVPCELFESTERTAELVGDDVRAEVSVTEADAIAKVEATPGTTALGARLIRLRSREPGVNDRDGRFLWAVSASLDGGIAGPSGAALYSGQAARMRAPGDNRPLTEAEEAQVQANVVAIVDAWYSSLKASYHIDYIDPVTGDWLSAVEFAEPDPEKFRSLLPPGVVP